MPNEHTNSNSNRRHVRAALFLSCSEVWRQIQEIMCSQKLETIAPFVIPDRDPETIFWGNKEVLVKWVEVVTGWVERLPFTSMSSPRIERRFSALLPFEAVVQLYTNGRVSAENLSDDEHARYHYSTSLCSRFNNLAPRPKMIWMRAGETIADLEMKLPNDSFGFPKICSGDVILTGIIEK